MELKEVSAESGWRERTRRVLRAVRAFLFKQQLPVGLIFVVILGGAWPTPGVALSKLPTNYICVVIIFLISGLKLKTDDIKDAIKSWKAFLYGIFSMLFLTSIICLELIKLLGDEFDELDIPVTSNTTSNASTEGAVCQSSNASTDVKPLGPREFSTGLQVFFTMPCTVSSGVVMVSDLCRVLCCPLHCLSTKCPLHECCTCSCK